MNNLLKDNRGITLIELIIVLAIISIISTILMPNVNNVIAKSKIKSDINSAKVIKNAIDLYEIEKNKDMFNKDIKVIIKDLVDEGYLNIKNEENCIPQTKDAEWYFDTKNKVIKIKANIPESILNSLSNDEKYYIVSSSYI